MPDKLERRWFALCEKAGLGGAAMWDELVHGYGKGQLAYHNLAHIGDCCGLLDAHRDLAEDEVSVELAIFFHDLVYEPRRNDNEGRSAERAESFLAGTRHSDPVASLIMATKHASPPSGNDARLICDIDLGILGRSEGVYGRYARAIRQEYGWVPEPDYRKGRCGVLGKFLGRERIFSHGAFADMYEASARRNLADEIKWLQLGD